MLQSIALAFGQLGDRRVLGVFARSVLVTLGVFGALGFAAWQGLSVWLGSGSLAAVMAVVVTLLAGWLLFRAVAIAVIGLFADGIVDAVEARHYPAARAAARPVGLGRAAAMGLRSAMRLAGYNLLASPLYIVLFFTGIGLPVAFFGLNGWLLGRDLGDMVAVRHIDAAAMRGWRAATRWRRLALGLAVAGLFVVPGLNLIAPILGAAAMTHLFHRGRTA